MQQPQAEQYRRGQDGIVAILAVSIIIILLSLITLGFARLMSREYRQAVDRDLSVRAYYAAESGINDARRYITANPNTGPVTNCSVIPITQLDADTTPTCILINPSPDSLEFDNINKDESTVFKMRTQGTMGSLLISWQSAGGVVPPNFAPVGQTTLRPQTGGGSWAYPPMLRVTVYQTQGNADRDRAISARSQGTYFLYPNQSNGAAPLYTTQAFAARGVSTTAPDGLIVNGSCSNATPRQITFGATTIDTLDCNMRLTNLNGNSQLLVRVTPLYGNADVRIFALNPAGNIERIFDAQTSVDVTGRATDQLKRLRGVIENRPNIPLPFGGIESADEICKRLRLVVNQPISPNAAIPGDASAACAINTFN